MIQTIGALFRDRRKSLGMTQEDLEELTGLRQSEISQIERGAIRQPGWDKIRAIAPHLQLTETDIKRALGWVVVIGEGVKIPLLGRIPADSIRFTAIQEGTGDMPHIEVTQSKVAGTRNPFALEVSGDCFRSIGMLSGDIVIVDAAEGRQPDNGQIVVVRINEEVTMKRWVEHNGTVQLVDGDGTVVHTIPADTDYTVEVIAFYVTYDPVAPR